MSEKKEFEGKTQSFNFKQIPEDDKSVLVKDITRLIEYSEYKDDLYELLEIDKIKEDPIKIPGVNMLLKAVDIESNKFLKLDIKSDYLDLGFKSIDENKAMEIVFNNLENVTFPNSSFENHEEITNSDSIVATPIYSSQSVFFTDLHKMNNYANDLLIAVS